MGVNGRYFKGGSGGGYSQNFGGSALCVQIIRFTYFLITKYISISPFPLAAILPLCSNSKSG